MTSSVSPSLVAAVLFLAPIAATSAFADPLNMEGMGLSRDIPCDGSDVGVYGANNTIHFTGTCKNIVVDGSGQTVTFEKAADLVVAGIKHKVTGGEVANLRLDGSETQLTATVKPAGEAGAVEVAGIKQKLQVTLAGPVTLTAQGFDHAIEWSKASGVPEPKIAASGIQTKIVRK